MLIGLLSVLSISIFFHLYYLIKYVSARDETNLRRFINTAVINIFTAAIIIIIAIRSPEQLQKIRVSLLVWFISGAVMAIMLALQIMIFVRVYCRAQMPENYHYNFFGKKVLHKSVIHPIEVALFFASMPALLIAGAYFVAWIIRLFI
ncbi:MAG: hypothetical protein A2176_13845 [Spirochaetes bacterium RBG_13_51_14]|nr:MAG: hypothetical protein A2176_13845 [Spirochaetes bacterium RBG_13_51_14]